ncbi:MAG: hypothetical protein ACO4CS_19500 [bacterium]
MSFVHAAIRWFSAFALKCRLLGMVQLSSIAVDPTFCSMGRVTINLNDRDHLAFKLLALQQDRKLVILIQDAMREYLERNDAYDLSIQGRSHSAD